MCEWGAWECARLHDVSTYDDKLRVLPMLISLACSRQISVWKISPQLSDCVLGR